MAITNINKEHLDNLLISLNKENNNEIEAIKSNHVNYELKQIASQIKILQNEANNIINDSIYKNSLHKIKKSFQLISGNYYYLYEKDNQEKFFSLLSPEEYGKSLKHNFLGKYLYDYDKQFVLS